MHEGRVLIVDDVFMVRETIARFLDGAGIAHDGAGTFEDAQARVERGGISVCIVDIKLGNRSGVELLSRVRTIDPLMRAVFITGAGETVEQYPHVPLVFKPLQARELVSKVELEIWRRCRDQKVADGYELTKQVHGMLQTHLNDHAEDRKRLVALEARPQSLGELLKQEAANPVVWGLVSLLIGCAGLVYKMLVAGGKLS
jgi:DNA-binding response OmpR family regulator